MPAIPSGRMCSLPVYAANFVLMGYGEGAIFGCPAHDQRDLDFARKYDLPVIPVVAPKGTDPNRFEIGTEAFTRDRRRQCRPDQFRFPRWHERRQGQGRNRPALGKGRHRRAQGEFPPARLGRVAPALLGLPDPGHPLPVMRGRAGAETGSAGHAARGCHLRQAGQSARPSSDLEARRLARNAAARPSARPTPSTPSSIHPGISRASARRMRMFRSIPKPRPTGCRSTSILAASSTRSCISSIRASMRAP